MEYLFISDGHHLGKWSPSRKKENNLLLYLKIIMFAMYKEN